MEGAVKGVRCKNRTYWRATSTYEMSPEVNAGTQERTAKGKPADTSQAHQGGDDPESAHQHSAGRPRGLNSDIWGQQLVESMTSEPQQSGSILEFAKFFWFQNISFNSQNNARTPSLHTVLRTLHGRQAAK